MDELPDDLTGLVEKLDKAYVATASEEGVPHIAIEWGLSVDQGDLVFDSWFCPKTAANLEENTSVVVALWDAEEKEGYQLEGKKSNLRKVATLDGYPTEVDREKYPQTEYRLRISVEEIYRFSPGPHSDRPR